MIRFPIDLEDRELERLGPWLTPDEVARAGRFHLERDRRRFVARRGRLREILGSVTGSAPGSVALRAGAAGKPVLVGPDTGGIELSVSHSGGLALVALAHGFQVGVDVELVRALPDACGMAHRFFAPEEAAHVASLGRADRDGAFFDYWVRKEAVVKRSGRGLAHGLASFVLAPPLSVEAEQLAEGPDACWLARLPPPSRGHVAALAAQRAPWSLRCIVWSC